MIHLKEIQHNHCYIEIMKRKKIILIVVSSFIFIIFAILSFVIIRSYQGYRFYWDFNHKFDELQNLKFVSIIKLKDGKIVDEIKVEDREDLKALANSFRYYLFIGVRRERICMDNPDIKPELAVCYPHYNVNILKNGRIGHMQTLRTYIVYDMPDYYKQAKRLYKKNINNKSFIIRRSLEKLEKRLAKRRKERKNKKLKESVE